MLQKQLVTLLKTKNLNRITSIEVSVVPPAMKLDIS